MAVQTYTLPGEYARWLANNRMTPGKRYAAATTCWAVVNDEVRKVDVIGFVGAEHEWLGHDYAILSDGSRCGTYYLFPSNTCLKPRLEQVEDEYGKCLQWVAPLKKRCKSPYR